MVPSPSYERGLDMSTTKPNRSPGKSHERSEENTQLSISLPKELRHRIERAAEKEDRSISSYLRVHLARVLENESETRDFH
jgi:hypothetical protein